MHETTFLFHNCTTMLSNIRNYIFIAKCLVVSPNQPLDQLLYIKKNKIKINIQGMVGTNTPAL
jgi:hypothetical protein